MLGVLDLHGDEVPMLVEIYIDVLTQVPSLGDRLCSELNKYSVRIFKVVDLHVLPLV